MGIGDIVAPLILEKVPTIKGFYEKVKKVNKRASTEDIFQFIKTHNYICDESIDDFNSERMMNMINITAPLYLKGYTDEDVKQSLLYMDNYIATEIQEGKNNEKKERAKHRKELTMRLFNDYVKYRNNILSTDL